MYLEIANATTPDSGLVLEGIATHFLAVEALQHTGRDPELAGKITELLDMFSLSLDDTDVEVEEFKLFKADPLTAQQYRGAIHDSLRAYLISGQIPDDSKQMARSTMQWIRCQSAINN